jgi:helix-turn-helix resolvase-like protein
MTTPPPPDSPTAATTLPWRTEDGINEIVRRYNDDEKSAADIAGDLGYSTSTVYRILTKDPRVQMRSQGGTRRSTTTPQPHAEAS